MSNTVRVYLKNQPNVTRTITRRAYDLLRGKYALIVEGEDPQLTEQKKKEKVAAPVEKPELIEQDFQIKEEENEVIAELPQKKSPGRPRKQQQA